jgi:hypothetical protein
MQGSESPPQPPAASDASDRVTLGIAGLVLAAVALLPVVEALRTPAGHVYSWAPHESPDYWAYQMVMRSGWNGSWLYEDRYTHEALPRLPIFPLFIGLGHVARWLGIPLPLMFHLARVGGAAATLAVARVFVRREVASPSLRPPAFVLALFASGVTWIFLTPPSDWYWIEQLAAPHLASGFGVHPHYLVEFVALAGGFLGFERFVREAAPAWLAVAVAAVLVVVLVHPFLAALAVGVPAATAVIAGWWPWRRDARGRAGRLALAWVLTTTFSALPPICGYFYVFFVRADVAAWRSEAISRPVSPLILIFLYGVGSVAAYVGLGRVLARAWADRDAEGSALAPGTMSAAWLLVVAVLVIARPIANWLEFALFASVPAGVLAVHGLRPWLEGPPGARIPAQGVVVVASFTGLAKAALGWIFVFAPPAGLDAARYWPDAYAADVDWLANQSPAVVLAPDALSLILPGRTSLVTYAGHDPSTLHYAVKDSERDRFFAGEMTEAEARTLVADADVRWVIDDRYLPGPVAHLEGYGFLELVRADDRMTVWSVRQP